MTLTHTLAKAHSCNLVSGPHIQKDTRPSFSFLKSLSYLGNRVYGTDLNNLITLSACTSQRLWQSADNVTAHTLPAESHSFPIHFPVCGHKSHTRPSSNMEGNLIL